MFTIDEKQHLLANLEIEVNHRKHQFKSWLNDHLENFSIHQEGLVSRIPKQVRAMKMRDFGAKYNGNIQAALRGVQREKFVAAGPATEIDKSTRKRKWVASQEAEHDTSEKAAKNARLTSSPQKKAGSSTGPGTAQRARMVAAKSATLPRSFGSPSPNKARMPFQTNTSTQSPRPLPRPPLSPSKLKQSTNPPPRSRVPSITTFNPMVPKTPGYPGTAPRLPRKDESMLSINGSPLANPYDAQQGEPDANAAPARTLKRTKSSITIQRDPSFQGTDSPASSIMHSRAPSQASLQMHQSTSSSSSSLDGHATMYAPHMPHPQPLAHPYLHHGYSKSQTQFHQFKFPQGLYQPQMEPVYSHSQPMEPTATMTPAARRPLAHTRSQSTLPITLATKDGHLLAFDALQTSPGELDALEGISDSAKKQAREEMRMLVRAAVDKWQI
ncbi:Nbl1-Borealin-N domain-containing protein [Favolaschia claudopus]|uniref:Nbl1-Borealin-N domain-containing protein n=1 Tax=Favolaschia claudopus TaxID=2862362 RepID=A0AAW0D9P1_9AGAR